MKTDTLENGLVFLEKTSQRTWGFSWTLSEGWEIALEEKGEGPSTVLIVHPQEPKQIQYELGREGEDPDFNCQIDLELSDGII